MLEQTFCHIQGVGLETEREIWAQGCKTWADFLDNPGEFKCGSASIEVVTGTLKRSQDALAAGNHQYFAGLLGLTHSWRAWPAFRSSCVYLDIETDGGNFGQAVTTIGLFDGNEFKALIKGEDIESFRDVMSHYSMVVTFYGAGFDLPMLCKRFPGFTFDQIHLDLCHSLKKLGYKGGLKKIEKQLGLARSEETDGLDGRDAIRLWREWQRGSRESLDTLIAYNKEDVVNLEVLAQVCYDQSVEHLQRTITTSTFGTGSN